jgi:hypothetical protein
MQWAGHQAVVLMHLPCLTVSVVTLNSRAYQNHAKVEPPTATVADQKTSWNRSRPPHAQQQHGYRLEELSLNISR